MNRKTAISALALMVVLLWGCDVVEPPYRETVAPPPDTTARLRKILIEDFTGFKCQNCPEATDIATALANLYKGQVYTLAIHAGFFATPDAVPPFTYDFRNQTSTDLMNFFRVFSNPNGMVNRIVPEEGNKRVLGTGAWGAAVEELVGTKADLGIDLTTDYEPSSRTVTVDVDLEYFAAQEADNYLAVYVVEDSIVQYQIDVRRPAGEQKVPDYVHNHVLRGSATGTWWGERVSTAAIAPGFTASKQFTVTLDEEWRAEHCKILVYVHKYDQAYDPVSAQGRQFEILQVEEEHVTE